jgi:hypothetical protein
MSRMIGRETRDDAANYALNEKGTSARLHPSCSKCLALSKNDFGDFLFAGNVLSK